MINWERRRDLARDRMEYYSARAETLFNRAVRERNKIVRYTLINLAERAARLADKANDDFLNAVVKLLERERRQERREREQLKKYRKRREAEFELLPPPPPIIIQEEFEEFGDDEHIEWEFGFEYDAVSGNAQNNVDVNFRVIRRDGKPFSAKEAARVMQYVREHNGQAPAQYVIRGIDWRRPSAANKRWVTSESRGVTPREVTEVMANVIDAVGVQPHSWRLGSPKD